MAVPKTPVLCAPSDADNTFGRCIMSSEITAGLKRVNPQICIPAPEHSRWWYPGQHKGQTCIWLGQWGTPKAIKITAFKMGPVPEFTQIDPIGVIAAKGWRAIFEKVITARAATRQQLEIAFNVNLDYGQKDDLCETCRLDGKLEKATDKGNACRGHAIARQRLLINDEFEKERKWRQSRSAPAPPKGQAFVSLAQTGQ